MNLDIVPGETKLEAISKVKEKITKTLKKVFFTMVGSGAGARTNTVLYRLQLSTAVK